MNFVFVAGALHVNNGLCVPRSSLPSQFVPTVVFRGLHLLTCCAGSVGWWSNGSTRNILLLFLFCFSSRTLPCLRRVIGVEHPIFLPGRRENPARITLAVSRSSQIVSGRVPRESVMFDISR